MKCSLSSMLTLLCFCLQYGHVRFCWAARYDNDDEDDGSFFKRIMLREVKEECDEDKLLNYLAKLQAVNPESIINLAAVKHLKTFCSDLETDVKEMNDYLSTCTPPRQRNLYYDLIRGIQALDDKLCNDNRFQEEFMKYSECYESIIEEYQQCAGPDDWTENPNDEEICKIYGHILQCYQTATKQACGEDAATIMEQFMKSVINSILTVKCDETSESSQVTDFLHEKQPKLKGKSSAFSLVPLFVILSIIIFIIVVYTTSRCIKKKNEENNETKNSK